jgi:hypothetical protein
MKKAMDKLKNQIAEYPSLYFRAKAKRYPEWALEDEEIDLISDSVKFALEILDIEFQIEALSITLTSIWWVIAYPVAVIGGIWMTKRSNVATAHPEAFQKKGK